MPPRSPEDKLNSVGEDFRDWFFGEASRNNERPESLFRPEIMEVNKYMCVLCWEILYLNKNASKLKKKSFGSFQ